MVQQTEFLPNFPNERELHHYRGYESKYLLNKRLFHPYGMLHLHRKSLKVRLRYLDEEQKLMGIPNQEDFLLEFNAAPRLRELFYVQQFVREGNLVSYTPTLLYVGDYNREVTRAKVFGHYNNQLWLTRYSSVMVCDNGELAYVDHDIVENVDCTPVITVTCDTLEGLQSFNPLYYFGPEITGLPGQSLMDYALAGYFPEAIGEEVFYSI